ncbi:MAG TPA: radical SAM protein [Candidatus Thermoplasmatota archaeon]|nr:radical SAM protein [Candidatus Thermoplasmatota archaeon]
MAEILLTADRTLMNNFHLKGEFVSAWYGSADSFPWWLFKLMASEPKKDANHESVFAPYPLRKIQAKLIDAGFDAPIVSPEDLPRYIRSAKILGIHTINPLGSGTSPIFRQLLLNHGEYSVQYFQQLLESKVIQHARKNGLKIIVGGAGAWQFLNHPDLQKKLGIDCIIVGEAECLVLDILRKGVQGEKLPRYVECSRENVPDVQDISCIQKASNYGCIEIGRGCVRGCRFCDVSKNKLRWIPLANIEKELRVNAQYGITQGLLHAEDILLYGTQDVVPDIDKLLPLIKLTKTYYQKFHFTHFSLAAVSAKPQVIPKCMELILENQRFIFGETGIETASVRLLSETMSGKTRPFSNEKWIEIIHNSLGILHDHSFVPYCSIILGLPGEQEEDVLRTLDLVDDLKKYRCALLPLNFTPLGEFNKQSAFSAMIHTIDDHHKQIIARCNQHNLYWVNASINELLEHSRYKMLIHVLAKIRMKQFERKAKKFGLLAAK